MCYPENKQEIWQTFFANGWNKTTAKNQIVVFDENGILPNKISFCTVHKLTSTLAMLFQFTGIENWNVLFSLIINLHKLYGTFSEGNWLCFFTEHQLPGLP